MDPFDFIQSDELQDFCSHCGEPLEFCLCKTWEDRKEVAEDGVLDDEPPF